MKKILLLSILALLIASCTSTKEDTTVDKMSRNADAQWWQEIGEPDSEYWWVNEYEDDQSD